MQGFMYKSSKGVGVFIESNYKTKCKGVLDRIKSICDIKGYNTEDELDAYIKLNLHRGSLKRYGEELIFMTEDTVEKVNDRLLIVQTSKEFNRGEAWLKHSSANNIKVIKPSRTGFETEIVGVFNSISKAINCLCEITRNPLVIHIHHRVGNNKFYKPLMNVYDLDELQTGLWRVRDEKELLISVMVNCGGSLIPVTLYKVKDGELIGSKDLKDSIALKYNKVFKHTVIPEIIKVIESVYEKK